MQKIPYWRGLGEDRGLKVKVFYIISLQSPKAAIITIAVPPKAAIIIAALSFIASTPC